MTGGTGPWPGGWGPCSTPQPQHEFWPELTHQGPWEVLHEKKPFGTVNPAFPNPSVSWNIQPLHHISQDYASWDTLERHWPPGGSLAHPLCPHCKLLPGFLADAQLPPLKTPGTSISPSDDLGTPLPIRRGSLQSDAKPGARKATYQRPVRKHHLGPQLSWFSNHSLRKSVGLSNFPAADFY